jgi:hypothetical protein
MLRLRMIRLGKVAKGLLHKVDLNARKRFIQEEVPFKMPTSSWPSPLQRTASHIRRKHFCNFPERLGNMVSTLWKKVI